MKYYFVIANDSIEIKGLHFSPFPGKTHYLGLGYSKLKAAHQVNYIPRFLGKNIKNYPPSKLFLFTFLVQWLYFLINICAATKRYNTTLTRYMYSKLLLTN